MDLVKSWLGQAMRATGAAVVAPVAVLLALSFSAIGGGGLGGLSQIVSGPEVAGSGLRVDDGDREIGRAVSQLADRSPGEGAAGGGIGSTPGGGSNGVGEGGGDGPGGGAPPGGGGSPPGDGPPGGDQPPGGGPPPGGGGGGGGAPPTGPPPEEPPGAVEGVGETVTDMTGGTPVAPTVEDAVDGLVEVCGRLNCP